MSLEVKWQGDPLPRGRHKLPASTVRASQRERLVRAMLECVASDGYDATTVPQVVARARVSRNAFYEFFGDKADCFIAVCDETAQELLSELLELVTEPDWIAAMSEGARRYLGWWQQHPTVARAYLLSLPTSGERAVRQRERHYDAFRAMFADLGRRARAEQPELGPLSELVPRVLVILITELVAEEVRAGRIDELPDLAEEVALLAIRLLADDVTARREHDRVAQALRRGEPGSGTRAGDAGARRATGAPARPAGTTRDARGRAPKGSPASRP